MTVETTRTPSAAHVTLFVFAVVLAFGIGHFVGIVTTAVQRGSFVYDFHFYSMLLVGALMVVPSVVGLRQVRAMKRRDSFAWRRARRASFILLAVNLPMLPMQNGGAFVIFGATIATLAAIHATQLTVNRREFFSRA